MEAKAKKTNRLETIKRVGQMIDAYYEEIRRAPQEDKQVCWWFGFPGFPTILQAMDIPHVQGEGLGARLSARKEEKEPQALAETEGFPREICSYARSTLGVAILAKRGVPPGAHEPKWLMPKPDFLLSLNACSTSANWFEELRRWFKVPGFHIELPYLWQESELNDLAAYATRQFQECISFIEEVTHRPFNWEGLRTAMAELHKAATLRREAMELCKNAPAPASLFEWAISLGPVNILAGRPGTAEYFALLKEELTERVKNKAGSIVNEKYRLYWDGIIAWNKVGWLAEKFAAFNASVVLSRYVHLGFFHEPELIDPERPLESLAACAVRAQFNRTTEWLINNVARLCQEYSLDGIIAHAHRTCRHIALYQPEIMDGVSRKLGIPAIYFEGDVADESFYSDAEVDSKVKALLELIDAKRGTAAS